MEHLPFSRDLQDTAALFRCCLCQGEIYPGDLYYQTEEGALCPDCLLFYARAAFLPLRRVAVRPGAVRP